MIKLIYRAAVFAAALFGSFALAMARPNIVVIMTDDQSEDTLANMPRLKSLMIDHGVRFLNSFTAYPQCCPARAAFQLGQFAHNTDVLGNTVDSFGGIQSFLLKKNDALGPWFKAAGYDTAWIGKILNGYGSYLTQVLPGWDYWWALAGTAVYDYDFSDNGIPGHRGSLPSDHQMAKGIVKVDAWLSGREDDNDPFFLLITLTAPHSPYTPLPQYLYSFGGLTLPQGPDFNEANVSDKPSFRRAAATDRGPDSGDSLIA